MLSRRDFLKLLAGTGASPLFSQYEKSNPRVKRIYLFETNLQAFSIMKAKTPTFPQCSNKAGI